jgi:sulfate adenylyltransferase
LNPGPEPYRILFVCTANICRSPAAEYVARARFGESTALFRSAGFLTLGQECPRLLLEALDEVGVDASGHRSYRINEASLQAADLVLTMEGEHVQQATLLHRPAFPKVLALKEAAERMRQMPEPEVELSEFLRRVNLGRTPTTYLTSRWDVADPYRKKLRDYRRAVAEISGLVEAVIGRLASGPA